MKKEKLIKKYDKHVTKYESNFHNPTLTRWRQKLIRHAYGNVLEVGVGVGANFPYYDKDSVHVTGVDFSSEMIKRAKKTAEDFQLKAAFIQEDVDELSLENNSFDCIVSTLTLCSYPDPVATLRKLSNWCRPTGTVLLIEHGRSSHSFLSLAQRTIDPLFTRITGCHCNRDIIDIVEKANLKVDSMETYWRDIIYLIRAKPNRT